MSQEFENQPDMGNYQDPLANVEQVSAQAPVKKQSTAASVLSGVGAVVMWRLFGLLGGLICIGGFAVVSAIIKSKMSTAAKVILSVVTVLGFLVLLFVFILFSAAVTADM